MIIQTNYFAIKTPPHKFLKRVSGQHSLAITRGHLLWLSGQKSINKHMLVDASPPISSSGTQSMTVMFGTC